MCRIEILTDKNGNNILDDKGNKQYRGDSGTSGAFAKMALNKKINDLCVPDRYVNVFNPNDKKFHADINTLINDSVQVANVTVGKTTTMYPAGSVFKLVINSNLTNSNYPVYGAYHIKGINLNALGDKKETMSVPLVKAYYTAILDDVLKEATENDKTYIVHLAQIPGTLFGGTKITGDAMHDAVNEWIVKNRNTITLIKQNQNIGIRISIDYLNPVSVASAAVKPAKSVPVKSALVAKSALAPKVDPNSIKVMTFNTCWEALGASDKPLNMSHCKKDSGPDTPNTCRGNIFKVIKKSIDDKYDFILLQEMTSDFEDIMTSPIITVQLTQSPTIPNLKYYSDDKYYGYHYMCSVSCIGILHLQSMGHATNYFAGNLAGIPYTAEFKGSINAGARPFIMLLFEPKKLIVVNVHAPKDSFKKRTGAILVDYINDAEFKNAITTKTPTINDIDKIVQFQSSSPDYAFQYVIQDAIRTKLGISDTNLPQYKIIIAGDFNTPKPAIQIGSDKSIAFTTTPKGNALTGGKSITCAYPNASKLLTDYKNGGLSDHILSNMKMETDSYKIFDGKIDGADNPEIFAVPPEFSDHLPVYATIT